MTEHKIHFLKFVIDRDLSELYISMVIRALAFSMIGIFVPLYLYKELSYNLVTIIKFYLIYSLIFGIFTLPSSNLVSKIGIKKVILLSSPVYIIYLTLLYLLKQYSLLFFIVPIFLGLADALFWMAFHEDFANFSDKKRRGEEIGIWYTLSILAGVTGPLIGGIILTFFSFKLLFSIVMFLILSSSFPLFFSKDIKRKTNFSWNFLKHTNIKETISYIGVGAREMVSSIFWPIFIFIILGGYLKVGSLITIVGLITAIFSFIIGKLSDNTFKKRTLIKIGSIFHSISWFIRIFIKTQLPLIIITIFHDLSLITTELPFSAIVYNKAGKKSGNYFVFREISLCIGRIIVLLLIWITGSLLSSFVFAGIASLSYMLL